MARCTSSCTMIQSRRSASGDVLADHDAHEGRIAAEGLAETHGVAAGDLQASMVTSSTGKRP